MPFDTREDFAAKVEWEGGVFEALDYGLTISDVPDDDTELKEVWGQLETLYKQIAPLIDKVDGFFESEDE